jgi:PAS domain S-box-containing protein
VSFANGAPGRLRGPRRRSDLEVQPEHPVEEIKRLQRCINDLVSVFALPAVWSGGDPSQIIRTLLDVLLGMLRLDLIYVRLKDSASDAAVEVVRVAQSRKLTAQPQEIGEILNNCLGPDPQKWAPLVWNLIGDGDISIVPLRLGLHGEIGVIVAGSQRADFPAQTERLILGVAANLAAIGLQEARLLSDQKRVADELDQRVAQRTKELATANAELRLQVGVLQHIPVAAWTLGPDGTLAFVNQSWLAYTGQTLDDVQSNPEAWMTAIHPEDREMAARSFWKGIRSGRGFTMQARFRRVRDGTYRWHLNRAVALRDTEGNILRFVGTSTDIEDMKQSQENLRRAEEKTRSIIDTALDAVITMDAQGLITSWNRQAEIAFGWSSSEAIGQRMSDLIIPQSQRAAHEHGLRHFLATGEGPILRRRIEISAVRRGGAEFAVELEIMPMRLGQDWVFSAFIRDITDAKLAEEKLRESELNLRQMTETIPEMLWRATPEGAIDYCNARVLDYTGFSAEEVMGNSWTKLLHPDDVDQTVQVWMSCVRTGAPYRVEVRIFNAADRSYRWCVTSALPLRDQQGRILKWHGTVVDMHDWKQAQEELRNTQAELAHMTRVMTMGELAASIAHEVNQPLASIITNGETGLRRLARPEPDLEKVRELTKRVVADARRASEIIDRIRAMATRRAPEPTPLSLADIIEESMVFLRHEFQSRGISVALDLAPELPQIVGDRIQLQQVVVNLAINAVQAMALSGGRNILIRTMLSAPETVCCDIEDSGQGIDPTHLPHLFDSFFTTKDAGMGMGLAISRSIIEAHDGHIGADNNSTLGGARFSFGLPANGAG